MRFPSAPAPHGQPEDALAAHQVSLGHGRVDQHGSGQGSSGEAGGGAVVSGGHHHSGLGAALLGRRAALELGTAVNGMRGGLSGATGQGQEPIWGASASGCGQPPATAPQASPGERGGHHGVVWGVSTVAGEWKLVCGENWPDFRLHPLASPWVTLLGPLKRPLALANVSIHPP